MMKPWLGSVLVACLVLACSSVTLRGEVLGAYEHDEHTLHLYHFDGRKSEANDAPAQQDAFALKLYRGAELVESLPGFGMALSTTARPDSRAAIRKPQPTETLWHPETGAFTYEAIVRLDFDPYAFPPQRTRRMQIFGVDSEGPSSTRSFHLCFRAVGVLGATAPSLEFVKFAGSSPGRIQTIVVTLPHSGAHTPEQGAWYHVAVAYDGNENVDGNLKLYWTRITPEMEQANLLSTGKCIRDPEAQKSAILSIGNTGRKKDGIQENWDGLIDEVRISAVARSADAFLFGGASRRAARTSANRAAGRPEGQ